MSFVDDLRAAVGDRAVVTDPDVLVGYHHDRAGLVRAGIPLAAVHPRSTAEVADVVALAARHGVSIVPRGAGSGLAGGANAVDGGVVLSLTAMDAIVAIDTDDLTATVQPGVLNVKLSQRSRRPACGIRPIRRAGRFPRSVGTSPQTRAVCAA
jgi:glycolate oxidase